MVLLVYPLKVSLPNSSAILSYKLKMQQFSCPFYHHVKRPFKRPWLQQMQSKQFKMPAKNCSAKGKKIDCDLHKEFSK